MKKLLAMMLTSAALTTAACANAGPAPCPACPEAPVAKWGGWWLGAQLGYQHATGKMSWRSGPFGQAIDYSENTDLAAHGVFGGLNGSYNYQFNKNWLVGLEVSIDWSGMKGKSDSFTPTDAALGHDFFKVDADWTVAVVPRLAYVMNDSMFYVGAGWAGTEWDVSGRNADVISNNGTEANARFSKDKFLSAFRLAVGAAQRMNRVLLGVEGTYDWYGSISAGRAVDNNGDQTTNVSYKPRVLSAKVTLRYML